MLSYIGFDPDYEVIKKRDPLLTRLPTSVSARDTFGVYGDTKGRKYQNLRYNLNVRALPTTDHSNCVDVSKCYLACLFRAREVPKHLHVSVHDG